ncbi:hypothetical protein Micbo1qcDRAFT_203511 [Microdochium bolleyi]|uniref:Uncharacterized protein n=1 Tax=Microdochium bolleyi TaxID=196109 RepID=A0A136J8G4_9PEZI|nr:hypothetical protein Micbo1qcDRAFT_203511 [Microdochium bolleyi]
MGSEKLDKSSSTSGSDHAQKLHESLEQYEKEQQPPKRPKLVLAAVISLFCASAFGIILAGVTLARPVDITAACIARDLILFASVISWFYIGLHIRAARRDVYRLHPGPPQLHGEYLHATALLVARLAICIWVAALIAVSAMVAMAAPARGMEGAMPYLSLMICIGALPAFIVIAATIETTTVPFATACVSKPSLLTCRVSDFADDLVADESVSRRASLARARSGGLTPTTMMNTLGFRTGVVTPAAKPTVTAKVSSEPRNGVTQGTATPETPLVTPPPTYNPGGWRNDHAWDRITCGDITRNGDAARIWCYNSIILPLY